MSEKTAEQELERLRGIIRDVLNHLHDADRWQVFDALCVALPAGWVEEQERQERGTA